MSTQEQDRKVQHVETLGRASADVEMYGQQLHDALAQMYWAAQKGDEPKMRTALAGSVRHIVEMRQTLRSAESALSSLVVPSSENGTLEIPEPDEHESAWQTIFRMSGFAELLGFAEYARSTINAKSIAEPDAMDDVRFCQRLSDDLFEAHKSIKDCHWNEAWFELQGAMADLAIYRKAVDDRDQYHPELELAEHMFKEIDRIEQFVHTQRKTSEVQS